MECLTREGGWERQDMPAKTSANLNKVLGHPFGIAVSYKNCVFLQSYLSLFPLSVNELQ